MAPTKSATRLRVERDLPAVVARLWAEGRQVTWIQLAVAVDATRTDPATGRELPTQPFVDTVDAWERAGIAGKTKDGKKAVPRWFDWRTDRAMPVEKATLGPAVAAYLADRSVPAANRADLRTALRKVLPEMTGYRLPQRSRGDQHDREFTKAASRVHAARVHEVRRRARAARADGEYARQVRLLLEYAAAHRLLPLVLPPPGGDDLWDAARNRILPLARSASDERTKVLRTRFNDLKKAAIEMHGPEFVLEREFGSLTPQEATAICVHARTRLGWRVAAGQMESLLLTLRDEYGVGPFRDLPPNPHLVRGHRGIAPRFYLVHPDGRRVADADWDDLLEAIRAHGLPIDEWRAALDWYVEYSTLDRKRYAAAQRADRFPSRAPSRVLKPGTLRSRHLAVKAFVGAALVRCELHRRVPAGSLTPEAVFGRHFREIYDALASEWEQRATFVAMRRAQGLPEEDRCSHEASGGLHGLTINAGLIALALHDRRRHTRGREVAALREGKSPKQGAGVATRSRGIDKRAEGLKAKDPVELALFEAYEISCAEGGAMVADRSGGNEETGSANTVKDLERILDNTPAPYWLKVYGHLRDQVERQRHSAERRRKVAFHQLVTHTLMLGVLISTACRESELFSIRLDIQFTPDLQRRRQIRWRAVDRKNSKAHTGVLYPEIVPDWLLALYLDEVRPWLVAGQWAAKRERVAKATRPSKRKPVAAPAAHEYFFVNTLGRPLDGGGGASPKDDTPSARAKAHSKMTQRRANSSARFLNTVAIAAGELRMPIPPGDSEFGEHCVRAAMGHMVRKERGTAAAAQLLGDTEAMVEQAYSRFDGRDIDLSSCREIAAVFGGGGATTGARVHSPGAPDVTAIASAAPTLSPTVTLAATLAGPLDPAATRAAFLDEWQRLDARRATLPSGMYEALELALLEKYPAARATGQPASLEPRAQEPVRAGRQGAGRGRSKRLRVA